MLIFNSIPRVIVNEELIFQLFVWNVKKQPMDEESAEYFMRINIH